MLVDLSREEIKSYFQPLEDHQSWKRTMSDERFSRQLNRSADHIEGIKNSLDNPEEERDRLLDAHIRKAISNVKAADPDLEIGEEWPEEDWEDGAPDKLDPFLDQIAGEVAGHTTIAEDYASRPEEIAIQGFTTEYIHDDGNHMLTVNFPAETVESVHQGPIEAWLSRNENIPQLDKENDVQQFYRNWIRDKRRDEVRKYSDQNDYIQSTSGTDLAKAVAPFQPDLGEWEDVPEVLDNLARRDEDIILISEPYSLEDGQPMVDENRDATKWLKQKRVQHVEENIEEYRERARELGEEILEAFDYSLSPEEYTEQTINQASKLIPDIESTFSKIEGSASLSNNVLPSLVKLDAADTLRETVAEGMEDEYTDEYIKQSLVTDMTSQGWYADEVDVASPDEGEALENIERDSLVDEAGEIIEEQDTYVFDRSWLGYNFDGSFLSTTDFNGLDVAAEAGIGNYRNH